MIWLLVTLGSAWCGWVSRDAWEQWVNRRRQGWQNPPVKNSWVNPRRWDDDATG